MSASPTILHFTEGDASGALTATLSIVARLYKRRRIFQMGARIALVAAVALTFIGLIATVDYMQPLPRVLRGVLLVSIFCGACFLISQALSVWLKRRSVIYAAREISRLAKLRGNALVTLAEAYDKSSAAQLPQPYIMARLEEQARRELIEVDEQVVATRAPLLYSLYILGLTLSVILVLRIMAPATFAHQVNRVLCLSPDEQIVTPKMSSSAANELRGEKQIVTIDDLKVRVVPPAYLGKAIEETSVGDAPIRALAGSTIEVGIKVRGVIEAATLNFSGASHMMRMLGENHFSGAFIINQSGTFEIRLHTGESVAPPAPLVRAVEVYADAPPEARITAPSGDQLLRAVPDTPINVRWTAQDDLGLASVTLKYIKSRGEGDAAKFTNGEITLNQIERVNAREWRGATSLYLERLDVHAGDTLVFWIEARDRNPSKNNIGRSASLAVAIAAPEALKLNLSDLRPNEIGRFLLSERQIIIQTEKLHEQRARLAPSEFARRANEIASDQRDFKNSFNDYINIEGGEGGAAATNVEEKVHEAENERTEVHNHGIPEPPMGAPDSVREMIYAIRAMWDAEDALIIADTTKALIYEREALKRLKNAQLSARYIPKVMARSKPLDLKRRYAGELAEIKTHLERLARRPISKESILVRSALADAYGALGDLQTTLDASAGGRTIAIGRASERVRAAADRLLAISSGDHTVTIALAAGQLRIVETDLVQLRNDATKIDYAVRAAKSLALLTEAAGNLYAIAGSETRAADENGANAALPTDDTRAAEYFRRLRRGGGDARLTP
jgi:hypothetical protein